MEKCDPEVFARGQSLLAVDTSNCTAEAFDGWVQSIAYVSRQRVDWHFSGGVAHVLVLGDHAKAKAVCGAPPSCPGRIMRYYEADDPGLYRRGVTPSPDGAIAGFMNPLTGEQEFIVGDDDA
jgi:hypothetical protein